jgi:hypothetical protein
MTEHPQVAFPNIDLDDDAQVRLYADRPHLVERQLELEMFDSLSDSEIAGYQLNGTEDYAYICGCMEAYASDDTTRKALPELYEQGLINADRCGENVEVMIAKAKKALRKHGQRA